MYQERPLDSNSFNYIILGFFTNNFPLILNYKTYYIIIQFFTSKNNNQPYNFLDVYKVKK